MLKREVAARITQLEAQATTREPQMAVHRALREKAQKDAEKYPNGSKEWERACLEGLIEDFRLRAAEMAASWEIRELEALKKLRALMEKA